LASSARREKRGEAAGRGEICGGAGSAGRRGEEEKEGRERLTGGVAVSAAQGKKKKKGGFVGRFGRARWAGRPGWAER
jgi:hypothetical protein